MGTKWKFRVLLSVFADPFNGGEEMERDEESRPEFLCPFCAEDFDMVGLCCHIDEEHMVEAMNGVFFFIFHFWV